MKIVYPTFDKKINVMRNVDTSIPQLCGGRVWDINFGGMAFEKSNLEKTVFGYWYLGNEYSGQNFGKLDLEKLEYGEKF